MTASARFGVGAGLFAAVLVVTSCAFQPDSWNWRQGKRQNLSGVHRRASSSGDTPSEDVDLPSIRDIHQLPLEFASTSAVQSSVSRRSLINLVAAASLSAETTFVLSPSCAAASPIPIGATPTTTATKSPSSSLTYINPSEAQITHKLYMNVRISRQDGTFYVRDDLPDVPENRVFQGKLVVGLFGKVAPTCVQQFLSYAVQETNPLDDNPLPSYGRSYFTALDPATGLLVGGTIPSLQLAEVGGSTALQYGGRLLPAKLWIEPRDCLTRVSHVQKGLLTHRLLEATPVFGITTRTDTRELDRTHTAFGTLLMDEGDAAAFLSLVQDLPTYSVERPPSMAADPTSESVVDDAAEALFNAQRNFFRNTAKALGDTRLDKIYEGKILRRVEVTQVGLA